LKFEKIKESEF
jgi:hypothetical protein